MTHLTGHHREAFTVLPCPRRFYRRIQRQNICLEGNAVNQGDNLRHLTRAVGNGLHIGRHLRHQLAPLTCAACRLARLLAGKLGIARVIFGAGCHLLHAGCRLDKRRRLLLGLYRQFGTTSSELFREIHRRLGGGTNFTYQSSNVAGETVNARDQPPRTVITERRDRNG